MIEVKTLCLERVPPGDRWREPHEAEIFETLTLAIEHIYQQTGIQEFRFSAVEGKIYTITFEEEAPIVPKVYSIYGEEY